MPIAQVLFIIFSACIAAELLYFVLVLRFLYHKPKRVALKKIPISVIICAKNEAENLESNLPFFISQEYPQFEIVLVNDASFDNTLEVMKTFADRHENIKIVDVKGVERFWGSKKYALTLGIKAATYEYLLFSDADCRPQSAKWIHKMSSHFSDKKAIVLGYSPYTRIKGSLLNALIRFETIWTGLNYFTLAYLGQPYMGVGRNLAYTKALFFEQSGFMSHMDLRSGDDDLLVNQAADKSNIAICTHPFSFVSSTPKHSYTEWVHQKRRHLSTAHRYRSHHKLILGAMGLWRILFFPILILLVALQLPWEWLIAAIVLRYSIMGITLFCATRKFGDKDLMLVFPLLDVFLIASHFAIFMSNLFSKSRHWK